MGLSLYRGVFDTVDRMSISESYLHCHSYETLRRNFCHPSQFQLAFLFGHSHGNSVLNTARHTEKIVPLHVDIGCADGRTLR